MKKLLIILLLTTLFASCNKDDTNNSTTVGDVVIKLNEIKEITATSAICDVIIIDHDNLGVIERGVCWNEFGTPTVLNSHTLDGEGDGEFECLMTDLTPNTKYFVRAYAMIENHVKYGNELSFTTLGSILPEVQTLYVDNITQESANCWGFITNWETAGATNYGFCWSTTNNPSITDHNVQSTIILGGEFGATLIDLSPETTYYVRTYAENMSGLIYGNEIEFTTLESNNISPTPINGEIPPSVLPNELANEISQYANIYQGNYPPEFETQFVSSPHMLFYSTTGEPINTVHNDRYIAFIRRGDKIDFYGKQWDDEVNLFYEEVHRNLNIIGSGNNFTTYYITEGYPNGLYAKQSTIFSGTWDAYNNAVNDFKVVVILLETSGNPNLAPVNSYRILGDGDGVSPYTPWIDGKSLDGSAQMSDEDIFKAFRVR